MCAHEYHVNVINLRKSIYLKSECRYSLTICCFECTRYSECICLRFLGISQVLGFIMVQKFSTDSNEAIYFV